MTSLTYHSAAHHCQTGSQQSTSSAFPSTDSSTAQHSITARHQHHSIAQQDTITAKLISEPQPPDTHLSLDEHKRSNQKEKRESTHLLKPLPTSRNTSLLICVPSPLRQEPIPIPRMVTHDHPLGSDMENCNSSTDRQVFAGEVCVDWFTRGWMGVLL